MTQLFAKIMGIFSKESTIVLSEKNQIRQQIQELKLQITEFQKQKEADIVFNQIEKLPEFQNAKTILLYWATRHELPTPAIIKKWSCEKEILLPVVSGDNIIIKRYLSENKMEQGNLGIWEPHTKKTYNGSIDLVIVPGVAFDKNKNRLGRGKGYYDRFLKHIKAEKWGVGFDFQLLSSIPANSADVKMDKIITPNEIIE